MRNIILAVWPVKIGRIILIAFFDFLLIVLSTGSPAASAKIINVILNFKPSP